ncbi:EGFR-like transmembrane domain-containing protein [Nocardia farcinica]|uniref:EGFR-like transmembrane domain-containing protein n=1 Tax=Nocardia farcinica TaxID=37329 RepID=UPI001E3CD23A|nr:transmembrane domain-containing protein [Nocardia farcinica]
MATDDADTSKDAENTDSVELKKDTSAAAAAQSDAAKTDAPQADKDAGKDTADKDPADKAEDAAAGKAGGGATAVGERRSSSLPLIAAFVAGVLLVGAITAVVAFYLMADRRGAELSAVDDATRAACDFGRTVSEYDYANNLEGYFTKVKDNATGEFRQEFEDASQALTDAMVQAQVKSWVDDVQCGFQNGDTEQAKVLVTLTQFRTNFSQQTPDRQYVVVIADLQNEDGRWKVAKLDSPMLKGTGTGLPGGAPAPVEPQPGGEQPTEPQEPAEQPQPGN